MSLSSILYSEPLSFAKQAKNKADEFYKKKQTYMDKWTYQLIGIAREEILLKASLGNYNHTFRLNEHVYDLKEFKVYSEGNFIQKTENYELSSMDKDCLMSNIVNHYSNKEKYPKLICRSTLYEANSIFFSWEDVDEY